MPSMVNVWAHSITREPSRLIVISFLIPIFFGTALLMLPLSGTGETVQWVDALFTATSAICVTGLSTVDIGTAFSRFGQGVILALIQIGGFGIMIVSAFILHLGTEAIRIRQRSLAQTVLDQESYQQTLVVIKTIFWGTLTIEGIGAVILSLRFHADIGSWPAAMWAGVFHSISAFCNAGFSIFRDSFIHYQTDWTINLTVTFLIITGGLGFTIIGPLLQGRSPTGTHTRLTLIITTLLIIAGTFFFLSVEFSGSLIQLPLLDKFKIAYFQSVTARTAGFNTIDLNLFSPASLFFLMILMFVGGSPGSTAGGIKTTTLGVLLLAARSFFTGHEDVEYQGRRISPSTVLKSVAIFLSAILFISLFTMILLTTEKNSFTSILFEVCSAHGTVGLSLGLTPTLTTAGKCLISILMFIGRVGPITIVALASAHAAKSFRRYPTGRVMVG